MGITEKHVAIIIYPYRHTSGRVTACIKRLPPAEFAKDVLFNHFLLTF